MGMAIVKLEKKESEMIEENLQLKEKMMKKETEEKKISHEVRENFRKIKEIQEDLNKRKNQARREETDT